MKLSKYTTFGQVYILPYIKITYDKTLNGDYELLIGWINIGVGLSYTPKQRRWKREIS